MNTSTPTAQEMRKLSNIHLTCKATQQQRDALVQGVVTQMQRAANHGEFSTRIPIRASMATKVWLVEHFNALDYTCTMDRRASGDTHQITISWAE